MTPDEESPNDAQQPEEPQAPAENASHQPAAHEPEPIEHAAEKASAQFAEAPQESVHEPEPEPMQELYEPEPTPSVYERPPEPAPEMRDEPTAAMYAQAPDPEPEPRYDPRERVEVEREQDYPFGEPEIPMPRRESRRDRQRARDARTNLDLDLGRIKRRKRYGFFFTFVTVCFIAFILAPVTWVGVYLFVDAPSTVLMIQRAAEGQTIRHYPVPIERISPYVVRAVIAAEDANFCTHDGFDVEAIQDAMESNRRGRRTRGASTVSQQTAKNLFLWPERSWLRKGLETYFTALIEFMYPKRRIMEHYLNVAEWGDGNFGIEAAARARFGVSAADLTPLQAARLASVLPNPNRWRADRPGPYVRQRSATIVSRARVVQNEHTASCVLFLDRPDTN